MKRRPRYPVYVPSKGRASTPHTIKFLLEDDVDFRVVVEREEVETYEPLVGSDRLLGLPESNRGLAYVRTWIKEHSTAEGADRHWQLDDNICYVERFWKGVRLRCPSGPAFAVVEDFADRYENVGVAGMNYHMFGVPGAVKKPVSINVHVYSCSLVANALPFGWRLRYNDDVDFCLRALARGWCTALVNAFLVWKLPTMTVEGGNTADYRGDGRLVMARMLARVWPGVVRVDRRYGRPQHVVDWKKFRDVELRLRDGVDLSSVEPNEYGLELRKETPTNG